MARRLISDPRRLTSLEVDYAIEVPLGAGAEISEQVVAIDTLSVASSVAGGLGEVAEAYPEMADLADLEPALAAPEPPTTSLVVEYEVH